MNSVTKRCSKCKQEKLLGEFCNNKNTQDGKHFECKQCHGERFRAWREKNPEKNAARLSSWRSRNTEEIREYRRQYRNNNRVRLDAYMYEYRKRNRGKINAAQRTYREKNRDYIGAWSRKYMATWRRENKDRVVVYSENKRDRKKTGKVSPEDWKMILRKYNNACLACGAIEKIEMDHVVPLSRGGIHDKSNVQPLCRTCNSKKGTKTMDYRNEGEQ